MKPYKVRRFKGTDEEINSQWLEARKSGIGGSDASAVLGLNEYATPMTVWLEKTGKTEAPDLSDKESVYWGTVLEDVIAEEFKKRHPELKVRRLNAMMWSKGYPFMFASVDRVLEDQDGKDGILEIKTVGIRKKSDWDDGVPAYYLAQVNHYLAVTGYEYAYVAVLIAGQEYREYKIERDDEDIVFLVEKEAKFWNYVINDAMPPALAKKVDSEALGSIYAESDEEYLTILDEDIPELTELQSVTDQIKPLEERKKELSNTIKQRIGSAKGIQTPTLKVTWSRSETSRFDSKGFQKENPDLYNQYVKTSPRDGGLRVNEVK